MGGGAREGDKRVGRLERARDSRQSLRMRACGGGKRAAAAAARAARLLTDDGVGVLPVLEQLLAVRQQPVGRLAVVLLLLCAQA